MSTSRPSSTLTGSLIAFSAAILLAVTLLLMGSSQPWSAVFQFLIGPWLNSYQLGNMLNRASYLIITGLGIALAFKAGVFNLGGEGQVYAGALLSTIVCLSFSHIPGFLGIITASGAAVMGGAFIAAISAYLKAQWDIDELISSFLISYSLISLFDFLISKPYRDPTSYNIVTKTIPDRFFLSDLFPPSFLNTTLFVALIMVVLAFVFLFYTIWGYKLRISGQNRSFAYFGGLNVQFYILMPMILSGAFHGLAGGLLVLGTRHQSYPGISSGLGWNGIAVALIARNNPLGVIPAALLFAYLEAGATMATINSDFPLQMKEIIQGVVFLLITARFFLRKKEV